jgi:hypothetical protein
MIDLSKKQKQSRSDTNKEVLDRIEELQKTVDSLVVAKSKKLSVTDDSLFFGLIVTLTVLTIPLQTDNISRFFTPVIANIDPDLFTLVLKTIVFTIFGVSAFSRYYAAIHLEPDEETKAQLWRYVSIESLALGLAFVLVFGIVGFAGWFLPVKIEPGSTQLAIIILVFSSALLVVSASILLVERLEKRLLGFYKSKGLISKEGKRYLPLAFGVIGTGLGLFIIFLVFLLMNLFSFSAVEVISFIISCVAILGTFANSVRLLRLYKNQGYPT